MAKLKKKTPTQEMPAVDKHKEVVDTPLYFPLPKLPEHKILALQGNLHFTFFLKVKVVCGSYSTAAYKAYCTLTRMSSFIHLQRHCTHQAA